MSRATGVFDHAVRGALALGLVFGLASPPGATADDGKIQYNRDIRPILLENCFACHGADSAARKADLRLDIRDEAVDMGAIEPGVPDESMLVERIHATESSEVMPPPASHKTLTDEQKDLLTRWIAEGAEYQAHWSLITPTRPEPPKVKNEGWVRNPIDGFVLAKIEANGLTPAPEADRRALARRVSLDLTGLPPKPADVEAFVNDQSDNAYEKYVDALLQSPAWGEHRGRYWLDVARYADTHGYHFDNYREMWSFRDWVINAFNQNMPFDQFTIEQLAGDLIPGATLDQQIASGFNRCAMSTNEGGTIAEENLVEYTRDRTETVSAVWLGLTMGCAVCHDHKFDPISQREFYELSAFFNNSTQGAYDGNVKDTPPVIVVPNPEDRDRWAELPAAIEAAKYEVETRAQAARGEFDAWLAGQKVEALAAMIPTRDQRLSLGVDPREGDAPRPRPVFESRDVGDFEKDQPFSFGAWVKLPKEGAGGAIVGRMDDGKNFQGWDFWVEGKRVGSHVIHAWPDNALKVVTKNEIPTDVWTHVFISHDGSGKASGSKIYVNGRLQELSVAADKLTESIRTEVPLKLGQRDASSVLSDKVGVSDLRVYGRALDPAEVVDLAGISRALPVLAKPANQRPAAEIDALFAWWTESRDPASIEARAKLAALEQEREALKARGTIAHVTHEKDQPATAFVLFRGEYDKRRDEVTADTPGVLPPMPEDLPHNRLGFAKWLLLPENPLTARVTVNRFWQELFGQGIVRTAGDFGLTGEYPSNPELLDWLAVEFREGGWDVKRIFKTMVMSATYRQSAATTPEKVEADPENILLARGPRFRMDAEMVRDHALAASGLLVEKLGGPSVRPYQPDGVWDSVGMPESNTRIYKRDDGEALYRRSLYSFWKRGAPPAALEVLNAPNREHCIVRRERTNTPLQALATLNGEQFVEAARALAQRALAVEPAESDDARLDFIAQRLLARSFRAEELEVVHESLDKLVAHYRANPDDAQQLLDVGELPPAPNQDPALVAGWTMLANQLMNLDEVLNK